MPGARRAESLPPSGRRPSEAPRLARAWSTKAALLATSCLGLAAAFPPSGSASVALLSAAAARASTVKVPRCETITVKGARWGVYVQTGAVPCSAAAALLAGVIADKGKDVVRGPGPGGEYILYSGWYCPYFQMGTVTCDFGTKPVAHPARTIFGLSCATGVGEPACPARSEG